MTRTTRLFGLAAIAALGLTGCELVDDVLNGVLDLDSLSVLGIMPSADFATRGSPDEGKVTFALGGEKGSSFLAPAASMVEISDEKGEDVPVEDGDKLPGYTAGSFVLLVDGTGSMENSGAGCEGCPTDPERKRVEAAQILATRLADCGPDWMQSLMEFNTGAPSPGFTYTTVLADFGASPEDISKAADGMTSDGGTPLWDATSEVLDSLLADTVEQFDEGTKPPTSKRPDVTDPMEWGVGLVVISDGADTGSDMRLDELVEKALAAGVPIHAIGLGPASDAVTDFSAQPQAIEDLRTLALKTGGFYGYVADADELPALADDIAKATCGGYTELTARWTEPKESGERVNGQIKLKGTSLGLPITFTAP